MDREAAGRTYLQLHKIPELLQNLSALLLFHRPEKPKEFLINTLEKIKAAKQNRTGYPYLMDESNLEAMFGMLDPAGQGYITVVQYKGALESLGLNSENIPYKEMDIITLSLFKDNVLKQFEEMWAKF